MFSCKTIAEGGKHMQGQNITAPAEVKTKLDAMNLTDRFLFDETGEELEIICGKEAVIIRDRSMCLCWNRGVRISIN